MIARITAHELNRNRRARAILKFLSWQLRARLARGPLIVKWIGGAQLLASVGDSGVTGNLYTGLLEFGEMSFVLHALRPSDSFVDIGANAGCYSILASKVIGAKTTAFEPVPSTYHRLISNVRLNDIDRKVVALNKGVAEETGSLRFSVNEDSTNHVLSAGESDAQCVDVDVVKLDQLQLSDVFAIKIDVEGYELPVLHGAVDLLADQSLCAIILELNGSGEKYGHSDEDVVHFLRKFDFLPHRYDPWTRTVKLLDGKDRDSGNTIFVRNAAKVVARIKSGPSFQVHGNTI